MKPLRQNKKSLVKQKRIAVISNVANLVSMVEFIFSFPDGFLHSSQETKIQEYISFAGITKYD